MGFELWRLTTRPSPPAENFATTLWVECFLMGHSRSLFFIFVFSIHLTICKQMFFIKSCRWLDSNRGPLELEATALTTEPQTLPYVNSIIFTHNREPLLQINTASQSMCKYYICAIIIIITLSATLWMTEQFKMLVFPIR